MTVQAAMAVEGLLYFSTNRQEFQAVWIKVSLWDVLRTPALREEQRTEIECLCDWPARLRFQYVLGVEQK